MWYSIGMPTPPLPNPPNQDATPEAILNSISMEIEATQKSSEALGQDKMKRSSALAVDVLIQIMLYDDDNKLRRQAAKDIMEYVYGTGAGRAPLYDGVQEEYNTIFQQIMATNNVGSTENE